MHLQFFLPTSLRVEYSFNIPDLLILLSSHMDQLS